MLEMIHTKTFYGYLLGNETIELYFLSIGWSNPCRVTNLFLISSLSDYPTQCRNNS